MGFVSILETSYMHGSTWFTISALVALAVLVIWPLGMALVERRYIWAVAIFLLAPFGGIAWFVWRLATRSSRVSRSASTA